MVKRLKKDRWFVPVRGSYLPNNWLGWLSYLPFTAYLVFTAIFAIHDADSAQQAILFILPNWVAAAVVMTWLAKRTS